MGRNSLLAAVLVFAIGALGAGCASEPPAPATTPRVEAVMDPCAQRLHDDVLLHLLLFYSANGRLPESLDQVVSGEALICPVSGQAYVYNPDGLAIPGSSRRVIVYDAEPVHNGSRWAVVADPHRPGKPLVARVLQLSDSPVFTGD